VSEVGGDPVGILWLPIPPVAADGESAFVYDVEVDADQRGKGYGAV
jgi:hypothetical protein